MKTTTLEDGFKWGAFWKFWCTKRRILSPLPAYKSILEGTEESKCIKRYVLSKEKLEGKSKLLSEWNSFKLRFGANEIDSFKNAFLRSYHQKDFLSGEKLA